MRKLGTITFFAASALVVSAGFVRGGMPAAVPAAMSPASTVDTIQLAREAEPRDDRLDLRRADDVFLAFRSARLDDRGGHGAAEPGDDKGGHGAAEPGDDKGGHGEAEPGDDRGGHGSDD